MCLKKLLRLRGVVIGNNVRISVITVSYNAEACIEATIKSVLGQGFDNFEYIIIDGGSSDGTVDLIKSYKHLLKKVVIEHDDGIYHAMNKGVSYCNGDYVVFMNAGDTFFDSTVLKNIAENIRSTTSVLFGSTNYIYNKYSVIREPKRNFRMGMPFCHQSSVTKREILLKYPFEQSGSLYADYKFYCDSFIRGDNFQELPIVISNYSCDGVSEKPTLKNAIDISKCIIPRFGRLNAFSLFMFLVVRIIYRYLVRKDVN